MSLRLEKRPCDDLPFNEALWLVWPERGLDVHVCDAANMAMMNAPYAPDDFYTYQARWLDEGGTFWLGIRQTKATLVDSIVTWTYSRSDDGLRSWTHPHQGPAWAAMHDVGVCPRCGGKGCPDGCPTG